MFTVIRETHMFKTDITFLDFDTHHLKSSGPLINQGKKHDLQKP